MDAIVHGTGVRAMDLPLAHRLTGREGRTLSEDWARGGARAHRGTTVAGFPHLFPLLGPNTVLGHTSVVIVIEAQIRYVLEALAAMRQMRRIDAASYELRAPRRAAVPA